jgi:hypothetical protein
MIIMGHACDFRPQSESDPAATERLIRWKRRMGFDVEHLLVNYTMFEGKGGEDSRAYLYKNFHACRKDWLGQYLPLAHKHGLRIIVYFNCHWLKPDTFPPDHYVVDAAGKPKVIYGDGGEICCRGPFRAWSEKMAEDLGRYPIDGVFLDGPVKDACWCPHCRAAFQSQHGEPLPEDPSAIPPSQQLRYEEFLTQMPVGYIEAFTRGLHKHNPDAVVYCNGGDALQMKAAQACTQLVGEEGGFIGYGPLNGEFPFQAGVAAKRMECRARGRARVIFCDSGYKVYDCHVHPKGETAWMCAGTISNGANPWLIVFRPADKAPGTQMVYRFNRLIHSCREALTNGESLAETAILESSVNERLAGAVHAASGDDVHKREASAKRLAVPRHAVEFRGLYAALTRSGFPFDLTDEDQLLEGKLPARIKLLILPGVGAMSDRLSEQVRQFVKRGGSLLATFDTSLFDEGGARRKDYALADVFGAGATGELLGPSGLDYLGVTARNAVTDGLSQDVLPCPEYWQLVKASAAAKTLLYYYEKMPRRYAALPPLSKNPAAVLNRFGKGQAIFIPSTVGDLSLRYRFPDIRMLLRNAARLLARPPVEVEGGDEFVETTLRRGADGSVVLHLINWASGERPSAGAIPLGPLKVSIRLPPDTERPRSVRLAMSGRKARLSVKGRVASFVVPRIEEYELAILR